MGWIQRLERLQRKHRREIARRHVRAYRKRQADVGMRRIDLTLTAEQYAALLALKRHDETFSQVLGRLLAGNYR